MPLDHTLTKLSVDLLVFPLALHVGDLLAELRKIEENHRGVNMRKKQLGATNGGGWAK